MIFMNDVVAVHRPVALKVAEAEEDFHIFIALQPGAVLARHLHVGHTGARRADTANAAAKGAVTVRTPVGRAESGAPAVMAVTEATPSVAGPAEDLMLFQVDVDRVLPIIPRIAPEPVFGAVLLHGETEFVTVRKPAIDDPLSIVAIKIEVPRDARRDDARQLIEDRMGRGVDAVVGDHAADPELDTGHALAGGEKITARTLAVVLNQAIFQTHFGVTADQTLDCVEVDDDVIAFGHAQPDAGHLNRRRQQVSVIGDYPERNLRTGSERIGQEQFIETRRPAVQDAETIAPLADVEERLNDAIRQLNVAEQSLEIESVKAQQPGAGVQQLIIEHDRDVVLRITRQTEAGGFIAGIELVEDQVKAFKTLVSIFRGVIDAMVVIPQRAQ